MVYVIKACYWTIVSVVSIKAFSATKAEDACLSDNAPPAYHQCTPSEEYLEQAFNKAFATGDPQEILKTVVPLTLSTSKKRVTYPKGFEVLTYKNEVFYAAPPLDMPHTLNWCVTQPGTIVLSSAPNMASRTEAEQLVRNILQECVNTSISQKKEIILDYQKKIAKFTSTPCSDTQLVLEAMENNIKALTTGGSSLIIHKGFHLLNDQKTIVNGMLLDLNNTHALFKANQELFLMLNPIRELLRKVRNSVVMLQDEPQRQHILEACIRVTTRGVFSNVQINITPGPRLVSFSRESGLGDPTPQFPIAFLMSVIDQTDCYQFVSDINAFKRFITSLIRLIDDTPAIVSQRKSLLKGLLENYPSNPCKHCTAQALLPKGKLNKGDFYLELIVDKKRYQGKVLWCV